MKSELVSYKNACNDHSIGCHKFKQISDYKVNAHWNREEYQVIFYMITVCSKTENDITPN